MENLESKFFIVGLPEAGKTTFLAALWHVVNSQEVTGSLQIGRLTGEMAHLNKIRDSWISAAPIERTKVSHDHSVSMPLEDTNKDYCGDITFPDLSGESFRSQWTERQMQKEHAELIRRSAGGLIMINPQCVKEPVLILEVENPKGIVQSHLENSTTEKSSDVDDQEQIGGAEEEEIPYDAKDTPTQVQLVELLQFIAEINTVQPIPLAVVISAWDCIRGDTSPAIWTDERLPLLSQYLNSNVETFSTKYYGISAQGGKLEEAERLRNIEVPSERIKVVEDESPDHHDISAPIKWLMEQARSR